MPLSTDEVLVLSADGALAAFESNGTVGLSAASVERLLQSHGKNVVETDDDESLLMKFLEQF